MSGGGGPVGELVNNKVSYMSNYYYLEKALC